MTRATSSSAPALSILAATLALGMAPLVAHAREMPDPQVSPVRLDDGNCVGAQARGAMQRLDGGDIAYGITFPGRDASATDLDGRGAMWSCNVSLDVTPAPGWRLVINRFALAGQHRTQSPATSVLWASYHSETLEGNGGMRNGYNIYPARSREDNDEENNFMIARADGFGTERGPWQIIFNVAAPDESEMMPCGAGVRLSSELSLEANRNGAQQPADIALITQDLGFNVQWGWHFEPCGDGGMPPDPTSWLDGSWQTTYDAPGGHPIAARLEVDGDHGTFATDRFRGVLSRLTYDGDVVRGRWQASGAIGWVEWRQVGGRLEGRYGSGLSGPVTGRWNGQRLLQ